ncbi:MAG: class D beta-lactamase, partial [Polyangiaceae bacterium]|nr:class D beta-lactamase [Polyangiaceae bacterium]
GAGRMREWVSRLGFGNAEIGSVIDEFWLEGPLAISPLEEVRFFRRLDRGELPVSARSRSVVLDMLELSRDAHGVLRGKTGWAMPRSGEEHGWFVGSLEREGRPTIYIAVLVTEPTPRMVTARRAVAERILRELARSSGR